MRGKSCSSLPRLQNLPLICRAGNFKKAGMIIALNSIVIYFEVIQLKLMAETKSHSMLNAELLSKSKPVPVGALLPIRDKIANSLLRNLFCLSQKSVQTSHLAWNEKSANSIISQTTTLETIQDMLKLWFPIEPN